MRRILISFTLVMMVASCFAAITQTGYVKTRGRLGSHGQVIPGKRLPSATVELQNGSSVVSNQSGDFSLSLPANKFYLKNVKKVGYIVADPDILSKEYAYSANPLVLVLDEPTSQQDDKLASERKLRRNLQKQLQQREDELEALKEENKITKEQYREALQKLYSDQESNEKFIAEMAERYSKIDFDQFNDFQRQFAVFVQNGELVRADSLLRTKGNMEERKAEIDRLVKANEEEEKKLAERIKKLNNSKNMAAMLITDYCEDCYNRFLLCRLRFDNDSAAFWIKHRAARNPDNLEYQLEAGAFIRDYIADYPLAHKYFKVVLDSALNKYGPHDEYVAKIYSNIGATYCKQADVDQAIECYFNAMEIIARKYGSDSIKLFQVYNDLGNAYDLKGDYDIAREYLYRACELKLGRVKDNDPEMAVLYNNIGVAEANVGNLDEALSAHNKSLEIRLALLGENHPDIASSYNNIGILYADQEKYQLALEFYQKALSMRLEIFGENHPDVAQVYNNIGETFFYLGDIEQAIEYLEKALKIRLKFFGEIHPDVFFNYEELAKMYMITHKPEYGIPYSISASKILSELRRKGIQIRFYNLRRGR